MSDSEDYGEVDDGLADRIREAARERAAEAEQEITPAPDRREDGRTSAELTWAAILADYVDTARRQEQVTAAYLEAHLGMKL